MQWYNFSQDAVKPCFMTHLDSCDIFTNIYQNIKYANNKHTSRDVNYVYYTSDLQHFLEVILIKHKYSSPALY